MIAFNKQVSQAARLLAILLAVSMLTACGESLDDLNSYIATINARPAEPIQPIPPVRTYTPYAYEGLTGRDPFRQSLSEGSDDVASSQGVGPRPNFERAKEYLERYELDTLGMVGTFAKDTNYWALVRDPEGVIHRVPAGDYIGKNHGQVVAIRDNEIQLSELISDGAGGWLVREASIALDEG